MNASFSATALIVDPNVDQRAAFASALSATGFQIIATDVFAVARDWLSTKRPTIIITALKLGEYNGLQLVLRARLAERPVPALVTADSPYQGLYQEAQEAGATYVVTPVDNPELVAAVMRTLFRGDSHTVIESPFERRLLDRRRVHQVMFPDRRAADRRRKLETLLAFTQTG
jgi:DNA-binding response OmpR family regulator